ncbi:UDP-N-acetylmuramate:L-alanyl-gamma-D-glutamyl-meso-diaminopimelate ligase [Exilibacterium tricleocarpae]|uniref:UDP-N-acetylmuramate--L-alanyl-gamma-D-glutamyl-meso-2,6-diaminoheptandioate ligase n=1 Tax=Exilibacterium tricleocarpae TaxID=2591008 RepID=A0A545STI0_9GAMM|nr:UDP-N-acetylmuramate:L-alanyl-gamma-D-glutamyl-meso-diaminopimelate ligase [Exilibacterium tricleocarpae]TQV68274.1 UDP-N-acetylmuramate:L-alanyl-gamma-D-glutamyl-meso-diaminopimelate ligase [Exilibacterium tricleocarpae]
MHIHILGICGTFMGSLAQLAQALGHRVTGADANVYPPMSTQLQAAGIALTEGYDPQQLQPAPDLVVVGNVLSRGNPALEYLLDTGIPYTSGPQWLRDHLLRDKWVLAVAGTHGKTTTSSMLAWILEYAGMAPGYLIGGVPNNFPQSARLGESAFFVVEADEYDSAFFDKRSKFVHYQPRTLVINNLEFDHADIFPDLAAIQRQFHHLVRTVPGNGLILSPAADPAIAAVFEQGCWTPRQYLGLAPAPDGAAGPQWQARLGSPDGSRFTVLFEGREAGSVTWGQTGEHSVMNGLAAIAAARHVGVTPALATAALGEFAGVKRRMECLGEVAGVRVYDDFAHHPTAIRTTLAGLRAKVGADKILALIEPRSNTMRLGLHKSQLGQACSDADDVLWYQPRGADWGLNEVVNHSPVPAKLATDLDTLVADALALSGPGTHIVVMSNGGFGGVHRLLLERLAQVNGRKGAAG